MDERCDSCFAPKRKTGLHITGARINSKYVHRVNHYFCKGRDLGTSHFERPCGRGYNVVHPGFRTNSYKENLNRTSIECDREASPTPSQTILTKHIPSTGTSGTDSVPKHESESSNEKPATFVCEGIEVDFDSSDSEEEVRALKVVKVLKKNTSTNGSAIHICPAEIENRRPKIIPWVQGKVLHKHELPTKSQSGDDGQITVAKVFEIAESGNSMVCHLSPCKPSHRQPRYTAVAPVAYPSTALNPPLLAVVNSQVSAPVTPAAVIIPQSSARPSYVILSGVRKRTTPNPIGALGNCAIIKRPRFLFSQQVRPSNNRFTHPLLPFPRFHESSALFSPSKHSDLNVQEMRIIDDVLDMMDEVEMRAKYSNVS